MYDLKASIQAGARAESSIHSESKGVHTLVRLEHLSSNMGGFGHCCLGSRGSNTNTSMWGLERRVFVFTY